MEYSQNDPAWKNNRLGISVSAGDTIGNYGCYVTSIANVCKWAGHDVTPQQVNDICVQNGWFTESTPGDRDLVARDDVPALLCGNLQFAGRTNWSSTTDMAFFADASDPNVAYIIKIDASTRPGVQTHYVMVWATYNNGDLQIDDSWDGVRKKLSAYGNPSRIIYSAMKFVKATPPPANPAPAQEQQPSNPDPAPTLPAPVSSSPDPVPTATDDTPTQTQDPGTVVTPTNNSATPPTPDNQPPSASMTPGTSTTTAPTPKPKVIAPEPSEYYTLWELFVAMLKKLFNW